MASFALAAALTLSAEIEGGYANVAGDSGGETYRGIARNKNPQWPGWAKIDAFKVGVAPADIKRTMNSTRVHDALDADVLAFYRTDFWDKVRGDEISAQSIASWMFDFGVNSGPGAAIQGLQRALNILNRCDADVARWPDLVVDGGFGPTTMRVLNVALRHDAESLLLWCVFVRGAVLVNLMEKKESQETFARGWGKRLAGFIRRLYV